jgi:hypothetical protein
VCGADLWLQNKQLGKEANEEPCSGVVAMLKIVRGRHKSGRGWLAHCLEINKKK